MTHVQTWLNGQSATLPASRRGFKTCCLHQFSFPSSNGQDRGPSSRVCRFESGRECQTFGRWRSCKQTVSNTVANPMRVRLLHLPLWGRGSIARAPALQAGGCRLDSDRLHQLAVAQLASAPRSGRGDRRFESCRRDQHYLLSSTERERAATDREMRVRILPGVPVRLGTVTQRPECPPVERKTAGSNPVSVASIRTARNLTAKGPDS